MKKILLCILICSAQASCARAYPKSISSSETFYRILQPQVRDQLALTAVLFFDSSITRIPKDMTKDERAQARQASIRIKKLIKQQQSMFKAAGKAIQEVDFLLVDLARNVQLAQTYQLTRNPEIRLFRSGKPARENDKPAKLTGNFGNDKIIGESRIIDFVNNYFADDIETIIKAKAKAEYELAKARASAPRVYAAWGPYWGWGWGGGYWGGPYWGWGGGCCW